MFHNLPETRGQYCFNFDISKISFMKVGGTCDLLYIPHDIQDLIYFLQNKSKKLPIYIIGNLSNTIIPDSGIRGCCISLKNLSNITLLNNFIIVECGTTINNLVKYCINNNISCCEQLYVIPGTIGGALVMNAGVPSFEIKDVIESITLIDINNCSTLTINNNNMKYRNGNLPENHIAVSCKLKTQYKDSNDLKEIIRNIMKKRMETQPINTNTCGSTFKNPPGHKAWQLIKESGCVGLKVGGARVSDKHCNFIMNEGKATANDVIQLISLIQETVFIKTGILLEPEVKILGNI